MKTLFFIVLWFLASLSGQAQKQKATPFPPQVKRIVFLGNSITYAGEYVTNVEAYFAAYYPAMNVEFINVGLPSETVSGLSEEGHAEGKFPRPDLHERLARVLEQTKPDWVFACYGMNDGIYLPLDEERFSKFKQGITWLHSELTKAGVKKIIHLTPPIFDERTGGHPGYAEVLSVYTDWLLTQQRTAQWNVCNIHGAMKSYLETQRQKDAAFSLASDGVHPGKTGHWIISQEIIRYLGKTSISQSQNMDEVLASVKNGQQIGELVAQRQLLMKDAWLTSTGHLRPGMHTGLPLAEAKKTARKIQKEIRALQR